MDCQTENLASPDPEACHGSARTSHVQEDKGAEEPDSSQLGHSKVKDEDEDEDDKEELKELKVSRSIDDSDLSMLTDYGIWIDSRLRLGMEKEKKLYTGASTWARDEERLFEMLYLRQELPILPSFWEIDFRGIPISEKCFSTTDAARPIIYAHRREFRATTALTKLIDLTANVRTAIQCGLPHKAGPMIKKALDGYIAWAAQDGAFAHLRVVPNIIAEAVDASQGEAGITRAIENRMRALARLQREYLGVHRDAGLALDEDVCRDEHKSRPGWGLRLINVFFRLFETKTPEEEEQDAHEADVASRPLIKQEDEEDDTPMAEIPPAPPEDPARRYRRRPPVVYGLFIVKTSIFIMTVDSARGEGGHVSFHVDMDLRDYRQSVWNALTMAMVVCVARDELMSRLEDFDEAHAVPEADVDL